MKYIEFAELYDSLGATTKRLEKEQILSEFFKKLSTKGESDWVYLIKGRVMADYDPREMGISRQLGIKAIARSFGVSTDRVVKEYNKVGDLGEITNTFSGKKEQGRLFSEELSVKKVFENLRKLMDLEGKGSQDKKLDLISELLGSASGLEAKYILRTILGDLRIGVQDALIRDAIVLAFFGEKGKEEVEEVQRAFDMSNDFALVFEAAKKGEKGLKKVGITVGKPLNVMLPIKVTEIAEGFKVVGRPAALEHKYDGFRVVISKDKKGEVKLFTRKLEDVTKQFPDVVSTILNNTKGKDFIIDSEVVGYDPKTGRYKPFEAISQRIRRKYDIDSLIEKLPVEVNVFDVLYYDGKQVLDLPFKERREIVEKIVKTKEKKIRPSFQLVTGDDKEADKFYKEALKIGEEGIMMKSLDSKYSQGRRVGHIVKMKPAVADLDLVITGAEWGTGKRGGWLTSYYVACKSNDKEKKFVDVGKVSSGLKEKKEQGTTYEEMTKLLKDLIVEEKKGFVKVKPEVVVSVTYQNIQKSPSYSSGYAMRFPRITSYRPERSNKDIADLGDIEREFKKGLRSRKDTLG